MRAEREMKQKPRTTLRAAGHPGAHHDAKTDAGSDHSMLGTGVWSRTDARGLEGRVFDLGHAEEVSGRLDRCLCVEGFARERDHG